MKYLFVVLVFLFWVVSTRLQAEEEGRKDEFTGPLRVLVLYSNQRTLPANMKVQLGLWSSLGPAINSYQIELFEEYLEIHRLSVGDEEPAMVPYLRERYKKMTPDVVVSIGPQALAFSEQWMEEVFPEAVRVFGAVREDQLAALQVRQPLTGTMLSIAVEPLLNAALALLPETKEMIVVGGAAPYDRDLVREVKKAVEASFSLGITEIVGGTPESVGERLSQAGADSVVFFTTYFKDETGMTRIPRKVAEHISAKSAVPVFAFYDTMMGAGVVGVAASPFVEQGRMLGEVIERIADGESPENIGILPDGAPRLLFDDRAMKRFKLNSSYLPPGSELLFEEPGLIESHPIAFAVGTGTIFLQTLLIVALLITRQRKLRAERRAREMEHYFSTVFYKSPNPMAVIELSHGCFRDINPAWEALFGFSRQNSLGRSPLELGILLNGNDELYRDFLLSRPHFSGYERKMKTASGELRSMALFSNPIEIGEDELCILTALDMSDREEAETLRNTLARDNRAAQLGQVSAWIAHEINQPLGSILSNAEAGLLELERIGGSKSELRDILEDIKADNRRASRVVEQIRKMLGKSSSDMRPVSISVILDEIQRMAMPQAIRQSVDLRSNATGLSDVCVYADRVLLMQVLLNLIFNGMDAVAALPLSRKVVSVYGRSSEDGRTFEILVSDEGPGVPAGAIDSIFEFFYSTKEGGMGLGLAISRFIIEHHKGTLTLENQKSGGACFHIKLPLWHPES